MKKILSALIVAFLVFSSIILMNIYSLYNQNKIFNNSYQVKVINWNKQINEETELKNIYDITQKYKCNIYIPEYSQGKKLMINLYAGIGNNNLFFDKFKIKLKDKKQNFDKTKFYISNSRIRNLNQDGVINIFNNLSKINVYSILEMKNKPLIGTKIISLLL